MHCNYMHCDVSCMHCVDRSAPFTYSKGSDVDEITIDPSANWTPVDKPKDSKDDEADSPPQKKVKLDTSAPGTPSGGGTPRTGGSGSANVAVNSGGDGLKTTSAAQNCNSLPLSKV